MLPRKPALSIVWGLDEMRLLTYVVIDHSGRIVEDGHLPIDVKLSDLIQELNSIFEKYEIRHVVLENPNKLNQLKKEVDGVRSIKNHGWKKKIKLVNEAFPLVRALLSRKAPLELIESSVDDYTKCPICGSKLEKGISEEIGLNVELGEFKRIRKRGNVYRVYFEKGYIDVSRELVALAAELYDFLIENSIVIGPMRTEDLNESPIIPIIEGDNIKLRLELLEEDEPIEIYIGRHSYMAQELKKLLNSSLMVVFRLQIRGERLSFSYFWGKSERSAYEHYENMIIRKFIRWINNTGDIGFLFEVISSIVEEREE